MLAHGHAHKRRERPIFAASSRSPLVSFGEVNADEHMANSPTRSRGRTVVRSLSGKTHAPSVLGTRGTHTGLVSTAADYREGASVRQVAIRRSASR